ncbi:MAG: DNA-processing protein DprA [Candidatus Omnitrophica bacterium]|nr:DNA-processing protein DprA [Candidatus Omnitrophota bacterium]
MVGLNLILDLGSIRLKRLLGYFQTPQNVLKAPKEELIRASGIGNIIADKIGSLKEGDLDKELSLARKQDIEIISYKDEDYPENLKQISDPPIILYVKGELKKEDKFSLGIVGSRRASFYGLSCAEKFAHDLSGKGLTIVSGLARGVDTYAHKGALKAGGRTIAVIGSGLNQIYPPENKRLALEIAKSGAVISEFPMNTEPFKQNFPRRNRVISGLSLGVLVAEAARNSGALITADFALEQGRDVFALPGKIDTANSQGTNELIKQGAKLVCGIDDILEELNIAPVKDTLVNKREPFSLTERELLIYDLLSNYPVVLDDILERSDMDMTEAAHLLLKLELRKLIRQLPGKQFVRN